MKRTVYYEGHYFCPSTQGSGIRPLSVLSKGYCFLHTAKKVRRSLQPNRSPRRQTEEVSVYVGESKHLRKEEGYIGLRDTRKVLSTT